MILVKITGTILLIASFGLVGHLVAESFTRRPRELRQIQSALQMLETEMAYGASPLPEALGRISQFCGEPVKSICRTAETQLRSGRGVTAGEAWVAAVNQVFPDTVLSEADRQALVDFGATLGISDREDQMKHLKLTREQLKREETRADEDGEKSARMWKYLGLLTGLAVCIAIF